MLDKGKVYRNLVIVVFIGIVVIATLLILGKREDNDRIRDLNKKEQKLDSIHKANEKALKVEIEIRKIQAKKDSATIKEIAIAKKKDSLIFVRSIKKLVEKNKTLTEVELDSALIKAYEENINN